MIAKYSEQNDHIPKETIQKYITYVNALAGNEIIELYIYDIYNRIKINDIRQNDCEILRFLNKHIEFINDDEHYDILNSTGIIMSEVNAQNII